MTIEIELRHRMGTFALDVRLASEGRLTALFGRSGSGKTSIVNLIAGLARPDDGRIAVDGRVLLDTKAGLFVPRHKRRVGYVFQEARLFPHMSVRHNLGYGRWFAPAAERNRSVGEVVDLLGIAHLLDRAPGDLSGGEKQRVAIGRALLASPLLLLMDEPLAALDDARKAEILPYIERLRDESRIPIIYVSHSVAEVSRLANDVAVVAEGRIVAQGMPVDVFRRLDLFPSMAEAEAGSEIDTIVAEHDARFDLTLLNSVVGILRVPKLDLACGSPVRVRIRATDVIVATKRPEGLSALNVLEAVVMAIADRGGSLAELELMAGGVPIKAWLTRQSVDILGILPGLRVFAVVKTVSFNRRQTGRAVADKPLNNIN